MSLLSKLLVPRLGGPLILLLPRRHFLDFVGLRLLLLLQDNDILASPLLGQHLSELLPIALFFFYDFSAANRWYFPGANYQLPGASHYLSSHHVFWLFCEISRMMRFLPPLSIAYVSPPPMGN